ncbi:hypothetical protein [Acetivibrio cellulolyticus]
MAKWEDELLQSKISRIYKTQKYYKCPRLEKYKDYRNRNRGYGYHYYKESKYIRKFIFRQLRRKAKREFDIDNYYKFTSHDYKTCGWLTW